MNIFLACPTHDGRIDHRTAGAIYADASRDHAVMVAINQSSLLANNCNQLWCMALNDRAKHDYKYFAMLHSDIAPEPMWLDKLIALAEKHNADILSAIIPLKNQSGLTSTAVSNPQDAYAVSKRFTLRELAKYPRTFSLDKVADRFISNVGSMLLVNTGCMVARLDRPWCENVSFTIRDRIERGLDGIFRTQTEPEDWYFSRTAQLQGAKVMATMEVQALHIGAMAFDNQMVWGQQYDNGAR